MVKNIVTDEIALFIIHTWFEIYISLDFECMEVSEFDDCNGRGTCNNQGVCECDPGWSGYLDCNFCKLIKISKSESQSHYHGLLC